MVKKTLLWNLLFNCDMQNYWDKIILNLEETVLLLALKSPGKSILDTLASLQLL